MYLSHYARFCLLRRVPKQGFDYRNSRRGVAQTLALNQLTGNFDAIQVSLCFQASAASCGSATTSPASKDFDFSSFIIGEGVLTARFILTVR